MFLAIHKLFIIIFLGNFMETERKESIVKVTEAGTITLPKQFRKYMDLQRGDYVRVILDDECLVVKKAVMT